MARLDAPFPFQRPASTLAAFCQTSKLRSFDNRDVHKDVFAATVKLDEAYTFATLNHLTVQPYPERPTNPVHFSSVELARR